MKVLPGKILFLYVFLTFAGVSLADAGTGIIRPRRPSVQSLIGTVQEVSPNTIEVIDEWEYGIRKRFVYLGDLSQFQKGDRVRIRYRTPGYVVEDIRKMTPVQYKEGQNAGYILKQNPN